MTINMRRQALDEQDTDQCRHAGLLLDTSFKEWDEKGEVHSTAVIKHHQQAGKITKKLGKKGSIYQKAYEQWYQLQLNNLQNSQIWFAKLQNRLYLGMGTTSPIEAGIMLHHTYGVPYIPGSAIKGVLHHYAQEVSIDENDENDEKIQNLIFGKQASQTDRRDSGSSGYLIFNNAWWIPQEKEALTPEIITVHAKEYYQKKGATKLHPDLESPNPNPQIAIQGSFMFSIEGDKKLSEYALKLLKEVLKNRGIGAKTSSGYGYFQEDEQYQKVFNKNQDTLQEKSLPPEAQLKYKVKKLTLNDLPIKLGKERNKTKNEIGEENWETYLDLLKEKFEEKIQAWQDKKTATPNQVKAYKTIFNNTAK